MKWQISHQSSLFPKHFHGIDRTHQLHLKTLCYDSWDIQVKVFLAVSRHYPAQPFHPVMVLAFALGNSQVKVFLVVSRHYPAQPFHPVMVLAFALGNSLVAHICAWHHFLGVWLYSIYTIGHQNLEQVLCLFLPSHLVKSVSSAFILCCQPIHWECVSRRGLLHYSEGSVFVLR